MAKSQNSRAALKVLLSIFAGVALALGWTATASTMDFGDIGSRALQLFSGSLSNLDTGFGKLQINTTRSGGALKVEAVCAPCVINRQQLAAKPLRLRSVVLRGRFERFHFTGTISATTVSAALDTSWRNGAANGRFRVRPTPIAAIYRELSSIVPEARQAEIKGTISGEGSFTWPEMLVSFKPVVKGFAVDGLIDADQYRAGRFNYHVRDERNRKVRRQSGEGSQSWLPLEEIGGYLGDAVIASEDGAFDSHPGYDVSGMLEAARDNKRSGTLRRGGSTLTQQLAKNLFLDGERTYSRKLRELLYAVELERELGKRRILEIYLNIVEWGPGVFGAKEAAAHYFDKLPYELRAEEAAWLAAILRSPRRAHERQYLRNKPQRWRVEWVLSRMRNLKPGERSAALGRDIVFAYRR